MTNIHGERLCSLNLDRVAFWLGKKAKVTKPVERLFGELGCPL